MKSMHATALAVAFCCVPALSAHATDAAPIRIAAEVPYRAEVGGELIRQECAFGRDLSSSIVRHAGGRVVVAAAGEDAGRRLDIVVTKAHAAGGAISGPKWGRIYGELKEDGRVVGNFSFKRTTSRPFTFRACTTLKLVAEALGGDVARWLDNPTLDPLMTEEIAAN